VFVCSGNICRSPVAAAWLRHRSAAVGLANLAVDSAGTLGIEGQPICPDAEKVLRENGIDAGDHRSRGVREADVRGADWIVAMERAHLEYLRSRFPAGAARRVLLRAFERGSTPDPTPPDLEDPYGQPIDVYRRQVPLIGRCVEHLIEHLRAR
jgi:protein-tyrosine-phosphatase